MITASYTLTLKDGLKITLDEQEARRILADLRRLFPEPQQLLGNPAPWRFDRGIAAAQCTPYDVARAQDEISKNKQASAMLAGMSKKGEQLELF